MAEVRAGRGGIGCVGWLAIGAIALLVFYLAFWPSDADKRAERDAVLNGSAQVAVTADEFQQAYSDDEAKAKARFAGKAISLSGTVAGVRESNSDAMVVSFETADRAGVEASVDVEDRAAVAALKPGDDATVACARVLDLMDVRVLARCRLR